MTTHQHLTVYLIRHGETQWNREGRCQGVTDIPLTDIGVRQARALAEALAHKPLSFVLSSALQRSRETARIIAARHNLTIEVRSELNEWNQGELEGLTGAELLRRHQAYFSRWRQDPVNAAPPGGEPLRERQAQAWAVIDGLRERTLNGPVAVVSHSMTLSTILCAALGLDLANVHRLKVDIASKSTITFAPLGLFSAWVLTSLNDCYHLQRGQ
jgi:broad specificity phosphatase PhoE